MKLLYIDESGDNGFAEGSTDFFILAGISLDAQYWKEYFWQILSLRSLISQRFGLTIEEIKGSDLFYHRGPFFFSSLGPFDLSWIHDRFIELICDPRVEIFVLIKSKKTFREQTPYLELKNLIKPFNEQVWKEYLLKYEEYLLRESKDLNVPQNAMVYYDFNPAQEKTSRKILREFSRKFDPQALFPSAGIIDDIVFRDSKTSYFLQLADVLAFSVNRIFFGKEKKDVFEVNPGTANKLKQKLGKHLVQ